MATPAADGMRDRLRGDLRVAMKLRDRTAMAVLRQLIAVIDNAESVAVGADSTPVAGLGGSTWIAGATLGPSEVSRRLLEADDIATLLCSEMERRAATAVEWDRCARPDLAAEARAELTIIRRYAAQPAA